MIDLIFKTVSLKEDVEVWAKSIGLPDPFPRWTSLHPRYRIIGPRFSWKRKSAYVKVRYLGKSRPQIEQKFYF